MYKSVVISKTAQYALKALALLAGLPFGTTILGRDLAQQAGVPANYLSKILLALRNVGILSTARGSGGGYKLHKRPQEIRLIEVIDVFDCVTTKPACLLGGSECSDHAPCSAHHAWREVRQRHLHFLETTNLAEISNHKTLQPEGRAS